MTAYIADVAFVVGVTIVLMFFWICKLYYEIMDIIDKNKLGESYFSKISLILYRKEKKINNILNKIIVLIIFIITFISVFSYIFIQQLQI